ncbi:hypothetical protein [Silvanigrella aquatica]|uniref:Uncharacterized protein n=1 Tax=Silvanigrella aquatica TaxID=1915309 RepID=A0A1L4CYB7_9BACT|nr:hypothetical protein [Silvanigrella aquatica]APJ02925.1 hypothetical protein AXG55_02930 [Silvanigrella aquatica]
MLKSLKVISLIISVMYCGLGHANGHQYKNIITNYEITSIHKSICKCISGSNPKKKCKGINL